MPYKKGSIAEQAGKLRRKIKTRINRFQRELDKADNTKEKVFFQSQIESLRNEMALTYQRNPLTGKATGYDEDSVKIAVQNLSRQEANTRLGTSAQQRKNFMTQQELNAAVTGSFIGPTFSQYSREEVNIFYTATKDAWEHLSSTENRNEAILKYYFGRDWKNKDLSKLVKFILSKNKDAVAKAKEGMIPRYTEEGELPTVTDQKEYYETYISRVNEINAELFSYIEEEFEDFDEEDY